ncbi:sister chromatid cohesion 1 protein 4 [Euphorbia peplus]|nr:sister chromatid cohesion 1 protein 4 [Euphorbia peplus]
MFYSQFILAKKGPLGTIWIAAHLERKLRKNQVADTDIGISVDSILFPEVPIALRLSSHLLLGVVRIYSRKVNYLFDDCSEALLKIKQAFRSTAVDLPPEESTAPYHSITLPETFDLDDFELPDNDMFQGNYVDHHISTREQITLQDTMDGVVYSTSQFGLDERFGDGDTSQVGLDLEEDLFLDKTAAIGHDDVPENDAQASVGPMPQPETNISSEMMTRFSEDMPLNATTNKIRDLADEFDGVDYADAPCTPGLVEVPNVSSVKEGLACDDHLEPEEHNLKELMGETDCKTRESDFNQQEDAMELSLGDAVNHDTVVSIPAEENCVSEIYHAAPEGELLSAAVTTERIPADDSVRTVVELEKLADKNEVVPCNNEQSMASIDQINGERGDLGVRLLEGDGCDIGIHHSSANATVNIEAQNYQGLADREILNDCDNNTEQTVSTYSGFLRPCNSHQIQLNESYPVKNSIDAPELQSMDVSSSSNTAHREEGLVLENSTKVQGEECHVPDGIYSEEIRMTEPTSNGDTLEDGGKQDVQMDYVISKNNHSDNLNTYTTSEFSAPEKLLSAPQRLPDQPHDFLIETPKEVQEGGDGSEAGMNITGNKRSFTESSLTMQSFDLADSFGVGRSMGTVESIPGDDDLLSSILVGRNLSVLKIKPTPTVRPSKRAKTASRPSALKRKVLMDDSMVLHGDTIRQQLTSTEHIRRQRKKAPCTHAEILMLRRQFLEEEIFSEPVLTGMSAELTNLHNSAFDLISRVRVCASDGNQASFELVDAENSARQNDNEGRELEGGMHNVTSTSDADGQPSKFPVQIGDQQAEDHFASHDMNFLDHSNYIAVEMDLGELAEMEGYRANFDVAVATNSEQVSGEISEIPTDNLSAEKNDIQPSEEAPFLKETSAVVGLDGTEAVDQSAEISFSDRTELRTEEETPLEETNISASDEPLDGSIRNDADASLANMSSLNGGCDVTCVNVEQALKDIENDKNGVHNSDVDLVIGSVCIDDKDQNPDPLCDASEMDPTHSVGLEGDLENASMNHGDHFIGLESDHHNFMDTQNTLHEVTAGDYNDIQGTPFPNDTEFLNVDDDEVEDDVDDEDEGMPNTEDARLLENTGWSSRTRAVARYLQTLFDKEAEHGRKILSMENLLAGKTRKEASRMFFETLVLKTRDYIQVEQPKPFENISLKPRSKLIKSDF